MSVCTLCVYLFLLVVEEFNGEELVLVLLVVSEAEVVLVKILLPGTVRVLFTAAKTGAGLGCYSEVGRVNGVSMLSICWFRYIQF